MQQGCPYCGSAAQLVPAKEALPGHPDRAANAKVWLCAPCDAWAYCETGTDKPLGRMADAELRQARRALMLAFKAFQRSRNTNRQEARRLLTETFGDKVNTTSSLDTEACRDLAARVYQLGGAIAGAARLALSRHG